MKKIYAIGLVLLGQLIVVQQSLASEPAQCLDCVVRRVPEIDGAGAVLAVGLMASAIILVREKMRKK